MGVAVAIASVLLALLLLPPVLPAATHNLAHLGAASTEPCPFCPAPRTTKLVGAADTADSSTLNVSQVITRARAEGLNAVGIDAISRRELGNLSAALAMTDGGPSFSFFVLGLPHVTLIELRRLALISYQDYHMLLLTLAGQLRIIAGLESHGGSFRQPPRSSSYFGPFHGLSINTRAVACVARTLTRRRVTTGARCV